MSSPALIAESWVRPNMGPMAAMTASLPPTSNAMPAKTSFHCKPEQKVPLMSEM